MSLFRKALVVNGAEFLCLTLGLFQSIALSRGLGSDGVGQYTLILSALTLGTQLFSLGYPLSFLYHAKQEPDRIRVYYTNAFWLMIALGVLGGGVLAGLIRACPGYFGVVNGAVLGLCVVYVALGLLGVLGRNSLLVQIEAWRLGALRLASIGGSTLVLVLLWRLGRLTVNTALLGCSLAVLIRWVLGSWWSRGNLDRSMRPSWPVLRRMGSMGVRLSAADLVVILLAQVNVMMIKVRLDDFSSVGYYSRGHRIAMLLIAAGQAILPILFSHWTALARERLASHIEMVMRYASTGALVLVGGLVALSKPLVVLFYGREFLPAVEPLMILLPGTGMYLLGRVLIHALSSRGRPQLSVLFLGIDVVICALVTWLWVPTGGIQAAACAATLGHGCLLVLLLWAVRNHFGVRWTRCFGVGWSEVRRAVGFMRRG